MATNKQKAFIEHYLTCWNATQAALEAGYSERSAGSIGNENLQKPEIRQMIEARLRDLQIQADEVLVRLSQQARFDPLKYALIVGMDQVSIDLTKIRADGLGHMVKKLSYDKNGNLTIEFYDSQAALVHLGRHHALFTDKVAPTDPTGESAWNPYSGLSNDELDAELERLEQRREGAVSPAEAGATAAGPGPAAGDDPAGQSGPTPDA